MNAKKDWLHPTLLRMARSKKVLELALALEIVILAFSGIFFKTEEMPGIVDISSSEPIGLDVDRVLINNHEHFYSSDYFSKIAAELWRNELQKDQTSRVDVEAQLLQYPKKSCGGQIEFANQDALYTVLIPLNDSPKKDTLYSLRKFCLDAFFDNSLSQPSIRLATFGTMESAVEFAVFMSVNYRPRIYRRTTEFNESENKAYFGREVLILDSANIEG